MNNSNIISLVDHIHSKKKITTFNRDDLTPRKLDKKSFYGLRMASFVLDLFTVLIIQKLCVMGYVQFLNDYFYQIPHATKVSLYMGLSNLSPSLFLISFMTYFTLCPFIFEGKTLGAMVMKLNIVNYDFRYNDEHDHRISLSQSFRRTCGHLLSLASFGLFYFIPFLAIDKTSLPDLLSQTRVLTQKNFDALIHNHELAGEALSIDIENLKVAA